MNSFNLAATPQLFAGENALFKLPDILKSFGNNGILITGKSSFISSNSYGKLNELIKNNGIKLDHFIISDEPSPDHIDTITNKIRHTDINFVLSVGGGSVLDAGKAIAAMYFQDYSVEEFLEEVGTRNPQPETLPHIAVPTTSGTGSEATKNAVITCVGPEGFKKSLRHDNYVPKIAVLDPHLVVSCPFQQTVASGMDTFTQLVESYLSDNASPFTDSLAEKAIELFIQSFENLIDNLDNVNLRFNIQYASYISGITLANAGLGTVHGFASSIGGLFHIPHGMVCASLMPVVNRYTLKRIQNTENKANKKYIKLGKMVAHYAHLGSGLSDRYLQNLFIEYLEKILAKANLPKFSNFGVKKEDIDRIVDLTSNKNNPVKLDKSELSAILVSRLK